MNDKNNYRINFLVALHLVAFIGLIFPYGFPLFPLLTVLFLFYALFNRDLLIRVNLFFIIIYFSVLLYVFGMYNSGGTLYSNVINDLQNIILIIIIFLCVGAYNYTEYKLVIHKTLILFAYISPVLAILSLYKYYVLLNGVYIPFLEGEDRYPRGTSMMPDYNMFSLGMIIGLVSISYLIRNTNRTIIQLAGIISSLLVIISSLLSGSRRGLIILPIAIIYLIYVIFKRLANNSAKNNLMIISVSGFFCLLLLIGFKDDININVTNSYEIDRVEERYLTLFDGSSSFDSRTQRWKYSLELISEFNIINLVIGDGFTYLEKYGEKFEYSSDKEGYPHNPVISSFLYAGILGMLFTVVLILIPIIRVLINDQLKHSEYILIYLFILIFLIQSGNSIFSHHVMWFILLHYCFIPLKKSWNKNKNVNSKLLKQY